MPTVTLENNEKIEMSNEQYAKIVDAIVEAARGHNGEQLIRDLEPGEYEICGKHFIFIKTAIRSDIDISTIDHNGNYFSWINGRDKSWSCQIDFERYIGKPARLITSGEIVRIEPKTGTALLDELEPGTVQNINGVQCDVTICEDGIIYITAMLMFNRYAFLGRDEDKWQNLNNLSHAINKPVKDLVASDIVQLYPKDGEA